MKRLMIVSAALAAFAAQAELKLGTPFADGMVLQRGMNVPVWGWADAGEEVSVEFAGQKRTAKADATGKWRVDLAPLEASKESRLFKVGIKNKDKVEVKDVLVGEVWYCCGQSNTEFPLVGGSPRFRDRQGAMVAQVTHRPFIRFAYCSNYKAAAAPKAKADYPVAWKTFTPENLTSGKSFSAMGVYYALELYAA